MKNKLLNFLNRVFFGTEEKEFQIVLTLKPEMKDALKDLSARSGCQTTSKIFVTSFSLFDFILSNVSEGCEITFTDKSITMKGKDGTETTSNITELFPALKG